MANIKGLVQDPDYQKLSSSERRDLLSKFDPSFLDLNDQQIEEFSSKMSGGKSSPQLPTQDQTGKTQGSLLGDLGKEALEAVPFYGSPTEIKEGYRSGQQLLGENIAGKALGAGLGLARGANTLFNPIGKTLGLIPRAAQATGAALGGDTGAAMSDLTGARPIIAGSKRHPYDTGSQTANTLLNLTDELAGQVQQQPALLASISPKGITQGVKAFRSAGEATKAGVETIGDSIKEFNSPEKTINKFGSKYREILAPTKGEVNKIEIKSGRNLDDSYKLAAEEGLIIEKNADNKLDTRRAIEQLQEPKDVIQAQLDEAIALKPEQTFKIADLAEQAKKQMRDLFKNDADYEAALEIIDKERDAIIRNRGEMVNGVELNEIKKGMWGKGYNAMAPNANKISRAFGNVAKEAIEQAYKDADIKGLNAKLGDYITLEKLLENANGRVVARGKLGKYAAQGIGAVAGHSIGIPVAGELGGAWLGGKLSDYFVNPERITGRMARKVENLNLPEDPRVKMINQRILDRMQSGNPP